MDELVSQLEREVAEALRRNDLPKAFETFAAFLELIGDEEVQETVRIRLAKLQHELAQRNAGEVQGCLARHQLRQKLLTGGSDNGHA